MTRSLQGALHAIVELQAHLPRAPSVLVGAAALGAVTLPGLSHRSPGTSTRWRTRARTPSWARRPAAGSPASSLRGNGEGRTTLTQPQGAGFLLAGVVGYLGPSVFGLGAAELIEIGHIIAVLWLSLLALASAWPSWSAAAASAWPRSLASGAGLFLVARYATARRADRPGLRHRLVPAACPECGWCCSTAATPATPSRCAS